MKKGTAGIEEIIDECQLGIATSVFPSETYRGIRNDFPNYFYIVPTESEIPSDGKIIKYVTEVTGLTLGSIIF